MKAPTTERKDTSNAPPRFISFADQAIYLAHTAGGQQAVMQSLWHYNRPVDFEALARFRDKLARGRLARLIRPALLPFGRHQWSSAVPPSEALKIDAEPIEPSKLMDWADAQINLPMDPVRGPAWTFTVQPLTDGSTVASLVLSHCIADGAAGVLAVSDAVTAEPLPLGDPRAPAPNPAATLAAELMRLAQDVPAILRALAQFIRTARTSRSLSSDRGALPVASTLDNRTIIYPTAFVRVPLAAWDAKAKSLGTNRNTLLTALAAAFGDALGRVRDDQVSLLVPVNQRDGLSDIGGNRVSLASFKVPAGQPLGQLRAFHGRLQTILLRNRREPNPLATLLPLTPLIPKRAFAAARQLALRALDDLPVTCSHLGVFPLPIHYIDGAQSDAVCFRGVDRQMSVHTIEERHGIATLFAGAVPGFISLTFVAYQPGLVTEHGHLHGLVEQLLAKFGVTAEFFGA